MARKWKRAAVGLVVVVAALQFVPVDRSNPPVTLDVPSSVPVKNLLRRACYDCHSNQTQWPWYSYVAPVSWFVADHVADGRRELNFSHWDRYDETRRRILLDEAVTEIESGHMPPGSYTWLHGDAVWTAEERARVTAWAQKSR